MKGEGRKRTVLYCLVVLFVLVISNSLAEAREDATAKPKVFQTVSEAFMKSNVDYPNVKKQLEFKNDFLKPLMIKRVPGTPTHKKAKDFIIQKMSALNYHIELDQFKDNTPIGEVEFTNIIATKNPNAKKRLILAAHYDSKLFKDFDFIGATDSAAACGLLIHLAGLVNPILQFESETTLQFVFFDGEEAFQDWTSTDSIYGARHLAEKWEKANMLSNIELFMLLDLVGAREQSFIHLFKESEDIYERLISIEERLMKLRKFYKTPRASPFFRPIQPKQPAPKIEDDHLPFLTRGVKVSHLISVPFPSVWHKAEDNLSAVDMNNLEDLEKILYIFVCEFLSLELEHLHLEL